MTAKLTLDIRETRCDECLFSKARIVDGARMAEVIEECRRKDSHFLCHKHVDVMCRGFYETQPPSQMERICGRMSLIRFTDEGEER